MWNCSFLDIKKIVEMWACSFLDIKKIVEKWTNSQVDIKNIFEKWIEIKAKYRSNWKAIVNEIEDISSKVNSLINRY